MNTVLRSALAVAVLATATQAMAQVTFYEDEGFRGRSFTTAKPIGNFERFGFNDRASSVAVARDQWEVCEDARFGGRCVVLRPGRYASLAAMGLNDRISSVRMVSRSARVDDSRYAPAAHSNWDRREGERLYQANVTSVHAVLGASGERCWVEREQVNQERGKNVPAAIVGAVIGGVLGHQIGGGRGRDIATVGGAVGGAALGANMTGRDDAQAYGQDVQHCASSSRQSRPDYWDVTYTFHGEEHRMQMTTPPGSSVTVNEQGEPRA
ncbi:MAG TPA: beta/gamma crystallin-related protein [Burkholderiales bacterium]|nr:beta/gamma crystallin-related protein [Burkholderiales bacterium]